MIGLKYYCQFEDSPDINNACISPDNSEGYSRVALGLAGWTTRTYILLLARILENLISEYVVMARDSLENCDFSVFTTP